MISGCLTGGMDALHSRAFTEKEKLIEKLESTLKPGDYVLVKGSHGMHMEQIVDALMKNKN